MALSPPQPGFDSRSGNDKVACEVTQRRVIAMCIIELNRPKLVKGDQCLIYFCVKLTDRHGS